MPSPAVMRSSHPKVCEDAAALEIVMFGITRYGNCAKA